MRKLTKAVRAISISGYQFPVMRLAEIKPKQSKFEREKLGTSKNRIYFFRRGHVVIQRLSDVKFEKLTFRALALHQSLSFYQT